jgi:hypothetical protein
MTGKYVIGYGSQVVDLAGLQAWPQWQGLDPEYQRRALALIDASNAAGHPVGIGGTLRTIDQQTSLFLSRHGVVASGGCCQYQGKRYALHPDMAHAAPPGLSYHEPVTSAGKCLAVDFIGDMAWLDANCERFGITWIAPEPWHGQPHELPHSRSGYNPATMDPLTPWGLPAATSTAAAVGIAPVKLSAPAPTLKVGTTNDVLQSRSFQTACNFWKWHDAGDQPLVVDGIYGQKTAQACISMQRSLTLTTDGIYGPISQQGLQTFLNTHSQVAPS